MDLLIKKTNWTSPRPQRVARWRWPPGKRRNRKTPLCRCQRTSKEVIRKNWVLLSNSILMYPSFHRQLRGDYYLAKEEIKRHHWWFVWELKLQLPHSQWRRVKRNETLPKAQGGSSSYQSNFLRSYHKFLHKTWSNFIFIILIKNQLQNLNQTSASRLNLKFKILTKTQLQYFVQDSTKFYKISAAK